MITATVIWMPISLCTLPLPYRTRYDIIASWSRLVLWWLRVTCKVHHELHGAEHLPAGTSVVLSQHQSTWETLFLTQIFPPQVWVLKREILWLPFFGWAIALLKPIAIDRRSGRSAVRQVLKVGSERLNAGCNVVVFPEGTRVPPGERRRHAIGGALLAIHSGYPVIPVAHDAGKCWPRKRFLKQPGTIHVVIGAPIPTQGLDAATLRDRVQSWIEQTSDGLQAARKPPAC
jgi:1-acyl-sn-glycerol-3-phosphate acyltransferase